MSQPGISAYTGGYNPGSYTAGQTSGGDTSYNMTPDNAPNITNYAQGPQAGAAVIQAGSNGGATPWDPSSKDAFGFGFNDTGDPGSGQGYSPGQSYDAAVNTAAGQAGYYNNLAGQAAQNTNAPQINNPYAQQSQQQLAGINAGQTNLVKSLQKTAANGEDSAAYGQYQSGVQQGQNAQTALGNRAGGGLAGAGARRQATAGNAMTGAASQAGGQLVAQGAQQAAQAQIGTTLGQQAGLLNANYQSNQNNALSQATLQQNQQGIANAGALGYNSLAQNEQGQQLNSLEGASNQLLQSEGLGQSSQNVNNAQNAVYLGAATQAGAGLASAVGPMLNNQNNSGAGTSGASGST
jgi:hypothetical protein